MPLLRQELWNVRYSGHKRFDFFLLPDIQERESNIIMMDGMMDGMMGMGAGMLIWGIVGILLIVLLVTLIAKVSKR